MSPDGCTIHHLHHTGMNKRKIKRKKYYALHFMVYANDDNVNIYCKQRADNFHGEWIANRASSVGQCALFIFMSCRDVRNGWLFNDSLYLFIYIFVLQFIEVRSIDDLIIYYLKDIRDPIRNMLNKMSQANEQWRRLLRWALLSLCCIHFTKREIRTFHFFSVLFFYYCYYRFSFSVVVVVVVVSLCKWMLVLWGESTAYQSFVIRSLFVPFDDDDDEDGHSFNFPFSLRFLWCSLHYMYICVG